MVKILLCLLFCLSLAQAARILAVIPTPSFSHSSHYWPVWKELSSRGHQVTVFASDALDDPKLVNLTEINMHHTYEHIKDIYIRLEVLPPVKLVIELRRMFLNVAADYLTHPHVKKLINGSKEFDLVMVEALFPECLILGELFNAPTVLVSTMDASSVIHQYVGNQVHGFAFGEYNLPIFGKKSFTDRLKGTLYHYFLRTFPGFVNRDNMLRRNFGEDAAPVDQMLNKVSMTFINTNPVMMDARPMVPSTIQYGGIIHIRDPKPLPTVSSLLIE